MTAPKFCTIPTPFLNRIHRTGELQRGPLLNIQNNVLVNPDYTRAIARIVSAVAPYPEAREAVIAALRDLDSTSVAGPALPDRREKGAAENG
jgi:hypothetical protein